MRSAVLALAYWWLCIAFCNAQATRIVVPLSSLLQRMQKSGSDSIPDDSLKAVMKLEQTFKRRMQERIWQISEIIGCLGDDKISNRQKSYYMDLGKRLFAGNAQVTVKEDNAGAKEMTIKKFLKRIASEQAISAIKIDSIMVPEWDYALIEADTSGIVYTECKMSAVCVTRQFGKVRAKLPIIGEETEEGTEWVPLFGDMIITVKYKDEKSNKNNRNILGVIRD